LREMLSGGGVLKGNFCYNHFMKMEVYETQKKDIYTPFPSKRYEVAEDEFSRMRIQELKNIHHELEAEFGVPLSFSLSGSLIKGKKLTSEIAQNADIDLMIYFDIETFNNLSKLQKIKILKQSGDSFIGDLLKRLNKAQFEKHFKAILRQSVLAKLDSVKEKLGYKEIPGGDIGVNRIDGKSIINALKACQEQVLTESLYVIEWEMKGRKKHLATYFTLSIGQPVKKYRNQFLAELATSPDQDQAEMVWQEIKDIVEETERKGKIPKNIKTQFPQTLEDALRFYGVDVSKRE